MRIPRIMLILFTFVECSGRFVENHII